MKKNSFEKYPVFRYLCCLLAVSVLFTAVTFSRYSLSSSGNSSVDIAGFNCSYSIENFSSFSFSNADYLLLDEPFGEANYVDFVLSNYRKSGETTLLSGVDVQGSLVIVIPKDFADNLAVEFQYASQTTTPLSGGPEQKADTNSFTPQLVLSQLVYGTYQDGAGTEGKYYSYDDATINTEKFTTGNENYPDYGSERDVEEDITVSGAVDNEDGLTVTGANLGTLKIKAETRRTDYSISFQRDNGILPDIYLDLSKDEVYYTLELAMPGMEFTASDDCVDKRFRAYFTLTDRVKTSASWTKDDGSDYDYLITNPPASEGGYTIGDTIAVRGFHFDQTATYTDGTETTVRVQCLYDYEGGLDISLYHVAPVDGSSGTDALNYVHPMSFNNGQTVLEYSSSDGDTPFAEYDTGTCGSQYARVINIKNLTVNPLGVDIGNAVNRSYRWNFTAAFVQTSTAGGNA